MSFIEGADRWSKRLEIGISIFEASPGLHIIGGTSRLCLGTAQLLSGLALATIHYFVSLWKEGFDDKRELEARGWKSMEYAAHGSANLLRGLLTTSSAGWGILLLVKDLVYSPSVVSYFTLDNYREMLVPLASLEQEEPRCQQCGQSLAHVYQPSYPSLS